LAVVKPGLDRHERETEWQGLEPLVVDSPEEALPEPDALIERMMRERRLPVEESSARESDDPTLLVNINAPQELAAL
jgi:hypothetical protein